MIPLLGLAVALFIAVPARAGSAVMPGGFDEAKVSAGSESSSRHRCRCVSQRPARVVRYDRRHYRGTVAGIAFYPIGFDPLPYSFGYYPTPYRYHQRVAFVSVRPAGYWHRYVR